MGPRGPRDRTPLTARGIAWHVLQRVERDGAWADRVLSAALRESELAGRDRRLATELAYGTLRLRGRIDAGLRQVLDRKLESVETRVRNLLRIGGYQILVLHGVREAAAVSESVELARALGMERASGFVNAVLRQLARRAPELEYPTLEKDPLAHLTDWGSLPKWLAERWLEKLGPFEAARLAEVSTGAPPRTVRVSPGVDRRAVARRLDGSLCRFAPDGVTALERNPVRDPGFARGDFTVQDEASQLVCLLVGAAEGDTVVDCCAAPGGKSVQLAQQVGPTGEIIALELHDSRLGLIRQGARRLGLENIRVLARDVAKGFDLHGLLHFRRILVDAPCSGLGVLRRNPDARWRLGPADIEKCADEAYAILKSAARYVEPEGVLVYSVCTFTPEETSGVTERFLAEHRDFAVEDASPFLPEPAAKELVDETGALRTWPQRHGCDGFYAVRLVRAEK